MYRRSNWEDFKTDLSEFGKTFFINSDHTDPNSAWNMFKIELNRLSYLHIPTKMCKSRRDLTWITPKILRLVRKRDKMCTKLKHLNTSTTTKQFKDLKYNIQKQIRNAYWLYIESVIIHNHVATRSSTHLSNIINRTMWRCSTEAPGSHLF